MELGPVDRITADAVGEPGMRTFYLQMRAGADLISVIVEKEQVQLLAGSVLELLEIEPGAAVGVMEEAMALEEPIDPRWRAGRLSIGFEHERDRFVLEVEEWRPEPEEGAIEAATDEPEGETITLSATREQMLALSSHGATVAERGRPRCRFCGNPIDPEGHTCPATNGHRKPEA
ncbi:MAG: DUF3090 family protein [Actinomycetota bacterium]